jgi:spore coat polysaccharide biosynthesis predicted glycosyltransferase SpsG
VTSSILLRCNGSEVLGLGHIMRSLALADTLRMRGDRVSFAIREGPLGVSLVEARGYPVIRMSEDPGTNDLMAVVRRASADAIMIDVRDETTPEEIRALRAADVVTAIVDDLSDRRLAADLVFLPPIPQVRSLHWNGFTGQLHCGWEWVIVHPRFIGVPWRGSAPHEPPRVLVTGGGSDPAGITLRFLDAIAQMREEFRVVVVAGAGYRHHAELRARVEKLSRPVEVLNAVKDMAALMADCDLVWASFGTTAYEAAAVGLPQLFLCLSDDHAMSATAFVDEGLAVSLGVHDRPTTDAIASAASALLSDAPRRGAMATRARALVDGRGGQRIAQSIADRIHAIHAR